MISEGWKNLGYIVRKNTEIRPSMVPDQKSNLKADVLVDKDSNAFYLSDSCFYSGRIDKKKNAMVYDYCYVWGSFNNDFENMTNLLKKYRDDKGFFLDSDEEIENFSRQFVERFRKQD